MPAHFFLINYNCYSFIKIGAYPELELAKLLTNDTAKLAQLSGTKKFHILSLGLKALWLDGTDFLFMKLI